MTKLYYNVRRKDGISLEEMSEHWLYPHAPLGTRDARVLRYVQFHGLGYDPLDGAGMPNGLEPYDGVACAWWENDEVMNEYMTDPQILVDQDDMLFIFNHDRSVGEIMIEEVGVEPEGAAPIVVVQYLRRREDLTREEFQEAWRSDAASGPLKAALDAAYERKQLQGYLQNFTFPEGASGVDNLEEKGANSEAWDGYGVLYLNSDSRRSRGSRSPMTRRPSSTRGPTTMPTRRAAWSSPCPDLQEGGQREDPLSAQSRPRRPRQRRRGTSSRRAATERQATRRGGRRRSAARWRGRGRCPARRPWW